MSGAGRCYDNACMESFFATLKKVDGQKVQIVRSDYNFVGEIPEIAA